MPSHIWVAGVHHSTSQPAEVPHSMVLELYTVGCRRRCPHCHNKELWDFESGFQLSPSEIADQMDREPLVSAVALTGGEPLDQEYIIQFIGDLRAHLDLRGDNRQILLYTNGLKPIKLEYVLEYLGFVIFGGPTESEQTEDDKDALMTSEAMCLLAGVRFTHWRKEERSC